MGSAPQLAKRHGKRASRCAKATANASASCTGSYGLKGRQGLLGWVQQLQGFPGYPSRGPVGGPLKRVWKPYGVGFF